MRARLVVWLSAAVLLAGCGSGNHDESLLGDGSSPMPAPSSTARPEPARPTTAARVLEALAAAVRSGDRRGYAALLGGDAAFRAQQLRLFDNLRRLPVADLAFVRDGGVVRRTLRLGSYDAGALTGPAGIRVGRAGAGGLRVLPDDVHPARDPWDLTAIRVARSDRALVVTDTASAPRAAEVLAAAGAGAVAVGRATPFAWAGTAVVYVFDDPDVLDSYSRVPGGTAQHLGALTFPVRSGEEVVGSRIGLLAPALAASRSELERILRHELVHVALGGRDDDVPTWLAEGVAEYVASLPVPPARRRIPTVAVDRAEAGAVSLPDSATFHDADEAVHYAVSWMACDHLAATRGPGVLWRLLDAMHAAGVGPDGVGQDAVLRRVAGLDSGTLGADAGARIRRLFG